MLLRKRCSETYGSGLSETAWLDGVRGFAALVVSLNHILSSEIGFRFQGFYAQPVDVNTSLLQLPPFRIVFGMGAMVPLFFVISGYCLSISFIRRLRIAQGDTASFFNALQSAVFRRGIRLFVPFLTMALVSQVLLYLGAYDWKWWGDAQIVALIEDADGNSCRAPMHKHVRFLYEYLSTVMAAVNYGFGARPIVGLNPALWTIPAEFRGSLLIYLCFLGLARVRHAPRCWILVAMTLVLISEGMWELWTFVGGLLIAELHEWWRHLPLCVNDGPHSTRYDKTSTNGGSKRCSRVAILLLWSLGLYLVCLPVRDAERGYGPVYGIINPLTPPKWKSRFAVERNFQSLGAMACVLALGVEPVLRRPFESRLGQYLGRISFMVYLVHQLIARMLSRRLYRLAYILTGSGSETVLLCFSKTTLVLVILWTSEVLVKHLDKRSVALAKRLLEKWLVQ